MKIEIKCRFSGNVLFSHDAGENNMRITVEAAVSAGAYLAGANLEGAYLVGAYLAGANLEGADLARANLFGADLARANLDGAYLAGANLAGANLAGANLEGADLEGANLDGEALTQAPLSLLNLRWNVLITGQYMRIGCKRYTHEEWASFDDAQIAEMDSNALEFWSKWKTALLEMCKQHGDKK